MSLKAKHALVPGGTRGIGEQLVRELPERGVRVTAAGRKNEHPRLTPSLAVLAEKVILTSYSPASGK